MIGNLQRIAGPLPAAAKALASLGLGAFLLAGCTAAQHAAVGQGVEQIRQAKDSEAVVLKASVCAMSLGAYHRVNSDAEQRALDVLCGGADEPSITAGEVRIMRQVMEVLGGS